MKKLLIICGLLFSMVTFASAQGGGRQMGTPEERAAKTLTMLTEKLTLTADQQTKVKAILLEQNTQLTKAREEAGEDRQASRAKMMKVMEDNNAKINGLLTDDQKKTYATYLEERKAAMQNRGGGQGRNN
jgi:protein CpxP